MSSLRNENFKKSVRFDPGSSIKSQDQMPRDTGSYWRRNLIDQEPEEEVNEAELQQFKDQEASQSLRRFLSSKDKDEELNDQLKKNIKQSQKDKQESLNGKKLIETIGQKQSLPSKQQKEDYQFGSIKIDEKTIIEEAFITFRAYLRRYRTKVVQELNQFEESRQPVLDVKNSERLPEICDQSRQRRCTAWRGFVSRIDFHNSLKKFGFFEKVTPGTMDTLVQKIFCYDLKNDWVNYMKLIAGSYRYKGQISHLTKKFLLVDLKNGVKRMRAFRKFDEEPAMEIINRRVYEYIQKKNFKAQRLLDLQMSKLNQQPASEQDKIRATMNESADNLIAVLKDKIASSQRSLQDIFNILDEDNDQIITKPQFKLAFKKANIKIDEAILDEAFFRFDFNKDDKVSFNEFLSVILGSENKGMSNAFQLQTIAEDIVSEMRKAMAYRFSNRRLFLEALQAKNSQKVTMEEFCSFLTRNSNEGFNRIQMQTVFNYLDQEGKRYLKQDEFLEIYEHQIKKEEDNSNILKSQQSKSDKSINLSSQNDESLQLEIQAKQFYNQSVKHQELSRIDYLSSLKRQEEQEEEKSKEVPQDKQKLKIYPSKEILSPSKIEEEIISLEKKKRAKELKIRSQILLKRQFELENLMKSLSNSIQENQVKTGKSLRDIFDIFNRKIEGFLDREEFIIMTNFLCQQSKPLEEIVKALYFLHASYYSHRLSFTAFQTLVAKGAQLNSLYLKFKFRFGSSKTIIELDRLKKKIVEDFQRVDESKGQWIITLDDFKKILELNQIPFSSQDESQMVQDKVLSQRENQIYVNYKHLLPIIFPPSTQIQSDVLNRNSRTITHLFQHDKLKRYQKKINEEKEMLKGDQKGSSNNKKKSTLSKDSKAKASSKDKKPAIKSSLKKASQKVQDKPEDSTLKKVEEYMTPIELPDFYLRRDIDSENIKPKNDEQLLSVSKPAQKGKKNAKPAVKASLTQQLVEALPEKKGAGASEIVFQQQQKSKTTEMCLQLLQEMIEVSVGYGESIVLSKEIQKNYEARPVVKDVFVCLKDMDQENIDLLPKCIFTSSSTGRIMVLDKDSQLHQYDLISKKKLISLDLSIKVPLREALVLDAAFDSDSGRLYVLTDRWNIEVWEIGQDSSSPLCTIVLFSENIDTQRAIKTCYTRRYESAFPYFITLSESSHQQIIVNSTCVNNCLVFVDPISLCVVNVMYISPTDFSMSHTLSGIINSISAQLFEFQRSGKTFEYLFEGKPKFKLEGIDAVQSFDFEERIYEYFGKNLKEYTRENWKDLAFFLDQDNSGLIDKLEFEFLFEMIKYHSVRLPDTQEQLIKLAGISEGAFGLLNSLTRFLQRQRKSIEDAFKAFDSDGTGNISCEEFEFILQRICKGDQFLNYSKELIAFIDKDSNGLIDFGEFSEILGIASQNASQGIQFNGRKNLLLCIQKAYEGGIDVEDIFIKADTFKEGTLSIMNFRNILKWLPIGINEEELDYIMFNTVSYAENGGVNYVKLLTSVQFKNIKDNFKFKQSIAQQKDFEKYKQQTTTEKRDSQLITQKVIIESVIFLDDFELIIYTTVCPHTSIIFVAKSNKPIENTNNKGEQTQQQESQATEFFTNKMLAKLIGHKTHNPPTIIFVSQSGCLVSGEKLNKINPKQANEKKAQDGNSNQLNNAVSSGPVQKGEKNFTFDQNRSADILIWNLQKDLFSSLKNNPPWVIQPSRIIESAHYDSILNFTYLPYCQLIASTSQDNTIKLWNPIARPYSLVNQDGEASVKVRPGYYKKANQELTATNQAFSEVRRIYTGDQTCFGISSFSSRIPVLSNPEIAGFQAGKRMNIIELLITCNLSPPELINKRPRNPCSMKVFSVEKMQLEVPCNRHDEVIPMRIYQQLEELSAERRKKAYVNYQLFLPTQLEILKSKKTLQQSGIGRILFLLKKISLTRFDDSQKYVVDEDIEELFRVFIKLPSRQSFQAFLAEPGAKDKITANELFYYLKKFLNLHPLNVQRDKFFDLCKQFKIRSKKGLFAITSSDFNDLERAISSAIRQKGLSFQDELSNLPSAVYEEGRGLTRPNVIVSKDEFLTLLHKLGLFTSEADFVVFIAQVDPLFTNKISSNVLQDKFSSDIIEYKLTQISKPKEFVEQLMSKLTQKQRIRLLFSVNSVEGVADGYLKKKDFKFCFEQADLNVDNQLIENIFDLYSEKFCDEEPFKILSVKYIQKKLFSTNENLMISKLLFSLGKIKSSLLDQGLPIEYIFKPITKEELESNSQRNIDIYSLEHSQSTMKRLNALKSFKKQNIANPLVQIGSQMFIQRVLQLQIPNIAIKELQQIIDFLSFQDDGSQQETITLNHFRHFLRKIPTKDQYLLISEHKNIFNEVNQLIQKEQELLVWKERYNKTVFNTSEIRYILSKMEVSGDYIDEIIIQFLQERNSISLEDLLEKFNSYVSEKPMLRNFRLFGDQPAESLETNQRKMTLGELLFASQGDSPRQMAVNQKQFKLELANYIRDNAIEAIELLISQCEAKDQAKKSELEISEFCNIIRFNFPDISQDLLINFQREYILENDGNSYIEYQEFFEKYVMKEEDANKSSQQRKSSIMNQHNQVLNINQLMKKIVEALQNSTVNVNYALKFIQNDQGQIPSEELGKFLELVKANLNFREKEILYEFMSQGNDIQFVQSQYFLDQVYIAKQGAGNGFDSEIWKIALAQIDQYTLDSAKQNLTYIERFVKQKQQQYENTSKRGNQRKDIRWPLVCADVFSKALQEQLQHDFDNKQQGELIAFGIVGSQPSEYQAKGKVQHLLSNEFDINKEIIHMILFTQGITEMFNHSASQKKQKMKLLVPFSENNQSYQMNDTSQGMNTNQGNSHLSSDRSRQEQYLFSKIKGIMKENKVTIWDALLSTELQVTENSKVPVSELDCIINSLNLKLTLQEKILLIKMTDPQSTGKCDINIFIKNIENEDEITNDVQYLILEKFSTSLFFNDLSLNKGFDSFDENKDELISQQDFIIGIKKQNLGMSIFEIRKLIKIINFDKKEIISKDEFIEQLTQKNLKFNIDPLKEFTLNLLTKIRNMISQKGADMSQAFEETDPQLKGYIYFKNLKDVLLRFGIENVRNYHVLTLYKLYLSSQKQKEDLLLNPTPTNMPKKSILKDNSASAVANKQNKVVGLASLMQFQQQSDELKYASFLDEDIDQQLLADEKIDYKDLCKKILAAVEKTAKSTLEITNEVLKKLAHTFQQKRVSLFEAFVFFDVNSSNTVSILELRVGLINMEIVLSNDEIQILFKAFEKNSFGKVTFNSFFTRFIESGAIQVIKFDDSLETTVRKFAQVITKLGNYEQGFNKIDVNGNGSISIFEFKEACKRLSFGMSHEEMEMVFKSILNVDQLSFKKNQKSKVNIKDDKDDSVSFEMMEAGKEGAKSFKYRHFAKLLSQFFNKGEEDHALQKLFKKAQEKKVDWSLSFQQTISGVSKIKNIKTKGTSQATEPEVVPDINLTQCKAMLNSLKLGLTNEEIDIIINSFDTLTISFQTFMDKITRATDKLGEAQQVQNMEYQVIVTGINNYLDKTRSKISQIFKDFNSIELGKLKLSELNNIIRFMQISTNISTIKLFFSAIDKDKKGYITISELTNSLTDPSFFKQNSNKSQQQVDEELLFSQQERRDAAKLEDIKKLIKTKLAQRQKRLSSEITDCGFNEQEALTADSLEVLITSMEVIVKRNDIDFLYNQIIKSQQAQAVGSLSFQSFMDYAIREKIEVLSFDASKNFIHPTVAVCVDKVGSLFKRLEIDATKGFRYLAKSGTNSIFRNEFLKVFQALDRNFTIDELLLIYSYFDEKNYGEIMADVFIEKFEQIAFTSLTKLNQKNEKEIQEELKTQASGTKEEESAAASLQRIKLSNKQAVQGIMQKIFFFIQEKNYSKKQFRAVLDRNGNGILSRGEFLESIKLLHLSISIDKAKILLDFIDREDTGRIDIDSFITEIFESVSSQYKSMYTHGNVIKIINDIISRISSNTASLLQDLLLQERNVRPAEESLTIYRVKSGIQIFDFYKVLRAHGCKLSDSDKDEIKNVFIMRMNTDFFDLDLIYNMIDGIVNSKKQVSLDNSKDNVSTSIWESEVYKSISEYLRQKDTSIEQVFQKNDSNSSGLISSQEFIRFIKSIEKDLSDLKLQSLVNFYYNGLDESITLSSFKMKFWEQYIKYERMEINKRIGPRIDDLKASRKKILTSIYLTVREFSKGDMEKAWKIFDKKNKGKVELDDFKRAVLNIGIYLTKEELKQVFNFIDQDQKNAIKYLEFTDFWVVGEGKLISATSDSLEGSDSLGGGHNQIYEHEESILEHICKVINQRELSLVDVFHEFNEDGKDYLIKNEFNEFLQKIGIRVDNDMKLTQMMRVIDPKSQGEYIYLSSLESRLQKYGLQSHTKNQVELIQWIDKPLTQLVVSMSSLLNKTKSLQDFFGEYDQDFDGFLTPEEFFQAFKVIGKETGVMDSAIQRLSHKLSNSKALENGKILIVDMCEYLQKLMQETEIAITLSSNQEDLFSNFITFEKPVFQHILMHFDGFTSLFTQMNSIKSSLHHTKKMLENKKQKIRGFQLISKQNSLFTISSSFKKVKYSIIDTIYSLRRQAQELINDRISQEVLDPDKNNYAVVDKSKISNAQTELNLTGYKLIMDNGIFSIDEESLKYFTPYIKQYSGQMLQTGEPIDIFVYSKEVLEYVCADGNNFVKILNFELKMHTILQNKYDFMIENRGVHLKRVGQEVSDIEYLILNEAVDPAEYICLLDLIQQNGGLLRSPVLVKLRSVTYLIKYITKQLLQILQAVNNEACFLTILRPSNIFIHRKTYQLKLSNVRGIAQYDHFSKVTIIPDLEFNLVQTVGPLASGISHLNYSEYFKSDSDFQQFYKDQLSIQPYLSPEQLLQGSSDWNSYIDVWGLGSLLYHLLFGKPPKSFYQSLIEEYGTINKQMFTQPSPFFHYNIYSDDLAQDILRVDYNDNKDEQINLDFITPSDISMVKAIDKCTFGNIFNKIFPSAGQEYEIEFQQLSQILDLISACLQFTPSKRPTIEGLLESPVFRQDLYEQQRAASIFETVFFYKSPSSTLKEKAFDPLRQLCALAIKTPEKIDLYQQDLLRITDYLNAIVSVKPNDKIDLIKQQSNLGFYGFSSTISTNSLYSVALPQRMKELLKDSEEQRNKHANSALIQFIFSNDLLDMLVFLALRHHKQITLQEVKTTQYTTFHKSSLNKDNMIENRKRSIEVLTALRELFKVLIQQLNSYKSPIAPYVHKLLENLVKLFIGEEYKLQSDLILSLNKCVGTLPERNVFFEYEETKFRPSLFQHFFERNVDTAVPDEADKLWKKTSLNKPYIFMSRNWSPVLNTVIGNFYKLTMGDAGVGNPHYPVLQDYIQYCSDKYQFSEFNTDKKKKILNDQIESRLPRSSEYYSDVVNMVENLNILYSSDKASGSTSSLKIMLNYFKAMLRSNNTDKIKLFLDCRTPVYLIPYLNTGDIHVRFSLLEIFLEISQGFQNMSYSYTHQRQLKSEEVNKNFGIVAHMNQIYEDKLDRKRYIDCANNYYFLRQQINKKFFFQLAFVFETPIIITNLFQAFKTKAELVNSKILVIKIFQNLVNGPESVIKMLNISSIDVFPSILRLLIKPKQGGQNAEQKQTSILAPIVYEVFKEIVKHARSEIIDILEYTPGVRNLLKEADLQIPSKLNLSILATQIISIKEFFSKQKEQVIYEIKSVFNRPTATKGKDPMPNLRFLHYQSIECLDRILSWFKHYFFTCKEITIVVEAKKLVDHALKIAQSVIHALREFAQVNPIALEIITLYAVFIENISNMGLHYVIFNKNDKANSIKLISWMYNFINYVYNFHSDINHVDDDQVIRRYQENLLTPIGHIFMRMLVTLTELDKPYIIDFLNETNFGKFYITIVKKQHELVKAFIATSTENIHVLTYYVEETNFRVVSFENLLNSTNEKLKEFIMENDFIKYVCSNAFKDETEFQVGLYRSSLKFLPFRNFTPLRNEALSMITAIVWHQNSSNRIYKDLLINISNEQLIKSECINLSKQNLKSNVFLTALYFFTVLVNTNEEKLLFLMKFEKVFEFLSQFFEANQEFKKYFPILFATVKKQQSSV